MPEYDFIWRMFYEKDSGLHEIAWIFVLRYWKPGAKPYGTSPLCRRAKNVPKSTCAEDGLSGSSGRESQQSSDGM